MSYIFNETLTISTGVGVGGTPISGGTDTAILFQRGTVVGEDTNFEWDYTSHRLKLDSIAALYRVPNVGGDSWYMAGAGNITETGAQNVGVGFGALSGVTSGSQNVAIGGAALQTLSNGVSNLAIGQAALNVCAGGQGNVGVGNSTLIALTSGQFNVAIGSGAGGGQTTDVENIYIGHSAGLNQTSGQGNIIIGGTFATTVVTGASITSGGGNIVIGYGKDVASGTAAWQMSIGNFIYGTNLSGVGSTISSGWIGIGMKAAFGAEAFGVTGGVTISGDPGGAASTNTITGVNSTTISTGTGTVKMSSVNNANNTGWLKCYVGTQVAWIPCWTTNAP